jgi:hypothetical protein
VRHKDIEALDLEVAVGLDIVGYNMRDLDLVDILGMDTGRPLAAV